MTLPLLLVALLQDPYVRTHDREVRVLLMEPWYSERSLGKILEGSQTTLVKSAVTCGMTAETAHYLDFLGAVVEQVARAHGLPEPAGP